MLPALNYVTKLLNQAATFELFVIPDMGHLLITTQDIMDIVLPTVTFLHQRFPSLALRLTS
jgi:dipeptidyl aminopeptidase/acylaminoacyl peptidase